MSKRKSADKGNITKPKRFLTAYNFFFMHERAAFLAANGGDVPPPTESSLMHSRKKKTRRPHVKTHGKISFTELTKLIVKKWKEAPVEEKKLYQELARKDLARYQREHKEYKKKLRLAAQDDKSHGPDGPDGSAPSASCNKDQEPALKGKDCGLSRNDILPGIVESRSAPLLPTRSLGPVGLGLPIGIPQYLIDQSQQRGRPRPIDLLGRGYPPLSLNLVPIPYIIPSDLGFYLPLLGGLPTPHIQVRPTSDNAPNSDSSNRQQHLP